jgi:adenosylmethionine-8-amino-7-oxononanoate aminotransferase
VDRGEGVYIYDKEGRQYIDGSGGAAVVNIGHGVKEIEEAMLKQASRIAFTHGTQFTSEAAIELADRIVKMSPRHYRASTSSRAGRRPWKRP